MTASNVGVRDNLVSAAPKYLTRVFDALRPHLQPDAPLEDLSIWLTMYRLTWPSSIRTLCEQAYGYEEAASQDDSGDKQVLHSICMTPNHPVPWV